MEHGCEGDYAGRWQGLPVEWADPVNTDEPVDDSNLLETDLARTVRSATATSYSHLPAKAVRAREDLAEAAEDSADVQEVVSNVTTIPSPGPEGEITVAAEVCTGYA